MKTGLILEGGAMRGLFTAGILDVMMEHRLTPDGIIGVSAGAAFGCNYKSGQPGRAVRYNLRFCQDPRYCSIRSLLTTGDLYGADFCYHELPDRLDIFDTEA
ncbi:MAG: patatin-like phospholipase family protein, partial [Clostridia bacterium]|nr:patatin-like phospholipase family protein [Clostridia bacterium]